MLDEWGITPLTWAAKMGHETVVKMNRARATAKAASASSASWKPTSRRLDS